MTTLIGRQHELEALQRLLDEARDGRGRAVVVLGDAGIGKTSLTEAFAEAAVAAGFTVAWGRCAEGEAPPYWPWRQALRALTGAAQHSLTTAAAGAIGGRDELFAAVADDLERATADTPAIVVIEDVHWADASSLALLRFIVGVLPDLSVVLVLTARDVPVELSADAAVALRDLPPAVQRLPIVGLDSDATGAIVRRLCGDAVPATFIAEVHDRTGGNPFFVQLVATLQSLHGSDTGLPVPPGVRQVLGRRLARVSQPAHEVLRAAAVAGELDPDLLAEMTGHTTDEVLELLDEASRARLVVDRGGSLAFAHVLVAETLYEEQSHAVRSELHAAAASALEARAERGGDTDGLDARLAAHWLRARGDTSRARARARQHAVAAARQAADRMAYEQASRYYQWALDAGASDRLALLLELGESQMMAGELSPARTTLADAAAIALDAEAGDELARAVLGMGGGLGGFEVEVGNELQIELLGVALRLLPDSDSSRRASVLARLSVTLSGAGSEARRVELARDAAAMAARVADGPVEVAALAAYCDAISGPDHCAERLDATARMVEIASREGDPRLVLLGRRMRVLALLELGRFAEADMEIAAYAAVADRLRLPLYNWPTEIWRAMRALMRGDSAATEHHLLRASELGRRAGSLNAEVMVFTTTLWHALTAGTSASMGPGMRWAMEVMGGYPVAACMAAATAGHADASLAKEMYERVRFAGLGALPRDAEWLEGVWLYGETGVQFGDREMVADAYDALLPYAHLWAIDGIGAACLGVTAHQLGRLAAYLGRDDDARRWLGDALEQHRAAGAELLVRLTEWALATLHDGSSVADRRPPVPADEDGQLRRDGRVWHVRWRGETATVPDSKGMRDLAVLVAGLGREVHVLDLVDSGGGVAAAVAETDTGPVLDREARAAYRKRLEAIEDELAEAERNRDRGRVAVLGEERDFLAAELAGALGLGRRDRRTGDRVERARKAVAMRLNTAIRAVAEVHPSLARHLEVSVATGRFCSYRPESPVRWHVET